MVKMVGLCVPEDPSPIRAEASRTTALRVASDPGTSATEKLLLLLRSPRGLPSLVSVVLRPSSGVNTSPIPSPRPDTELVTTRSPLPGARGIGDGVAPSARSV